MANMKHQIHLGVGTFKLSIGHNWCILEYNEPLRKILHIIWCINNDCIPCESLYMNIESTVVWHNAIPHMLCAHHIDILSDA